MPYLPASMRAEDFEPLGPPVRPTAAVAGPCQHQWVPVPDSKVHSRCANCGVVTLTEMVHVPPAPKPAPAPQTPVVWPLPLDFTPGKPPPDTRVDLCFTDGSVGYDYASNLAPVAAVTGWRPAHPAFSPHTRYADTLNALNVHMRSAVDAMMLATLPPVRLNVDLARQLDKSAMTVTKKGAARSSDQTLYEDIPNNRTATEIVQRMGIALEDFATKRWIKT